MTMSNQVAAGQTARSMLLLVLLAILYSLLASLTTLWDRDEPRFARAAVEMLQTGDYLVPKFDGELRPDKPPLIYWWMIPSIMVFGVIDFAVRVPSILASLFTALATFHIGLNLGGHAVATRAMVLCALMPLPLILGTAATADGLLLASVSMSLAVLVDHAIRGSRVLQLPCLALALSLTLLAKGPVGLAIFLLASVAASYWGKGILRLGRGWWLKVASASILALIIFLSWGIPANNATDGELARVGIGRHLVQRSTEALESHGGEGLFGYFLALPFYLPVLLLGAAPGAALVLPMVVRRKRVFETRGQGALIAALVVPTLLLMTLVATKLPHYILGLFPGLAVAIALLWTRAEDGQLEQSLSSDWSWKLGRCLTASLLFFLGLAWATAVHQSSGNLSSGLPALVLFTLAASMTVSMKLGSAFLSRRGLAIPMLLTVAGVVSVAFGAGQMEKRWKVAQPVAAAIEVSEDQGVPHDAPIVTLGYSEPSLVFALNRDPVPGQKTVPELHQRFPEGIDQWLKAGGPAWLFASEKEVSKTTIDLQSRGCRLVWSTDPGGIVNYSNGETVSLELWLLPGT